MRYHYLCRHTTVFIAMTSLRVAEFDQLVRDLLPICGEAEKQRLSQPDRWWAIGGVRL